MPIFGETVSPYDEYVEKVTAETMTTENWALMMDISDRILSLSSSSVDLRQASKQCLLSVKKRFDQIKRVL
jgi:hypothetical protein